MTPETTATKVETIHPSANVMDSPASAAAIDRIVHHGRMITFTGQSYRMANALEVSWV